MKKLRIEIPYNFRRTGRLYFDLYVDDDFDENDYEDQEIYELITDSGNRHNEDYEDDTDNDDDFNYRYYDFRITHVTEGVEHPQATNPFINQPTSAASTPTFRLDDLAEDINKL